MTFWTRWPRMLPPDKLARDAPWHDEPATESQRALLRRLGMEPPDRCTKGEIDSLIKVTRQQQQRARVAQRRAGVSSQ